MLDNVQFERRLRTMIEPYQGKPVIVHSDLFRASRFVAPTTNRNDLLAKHVSVLESLAVDLVIPAFNYSFTRRGHIDLRTAEVELGPLGGHMLKHWAAYRSPDPVFSFLRKQLPEFPSMPASPMLAFGPDTGFALARLEEGAVLMYGASVEALTLIHHVETISGGPVYRYDKRFSGTMITWAGGESAIDYVYHVRPKARDLEYDWGRVSAILLAADAIRYISEEQMHIGFVLDVAKGTSGLQLALQEDPLQLLNAASKAWVAPLLDRLGRRFIIGDFEDDAS